MKTQTHLETLDVVVEALKQSTALLLEALAPNEGAFTPQEKVMVQIAMQSLVAAGMAANEINNALALGGDIQDECEVYLVNPTDEVAKQTVH